VKGDERCAYHDDSQYVSHCKGDVDSQPNVDRIVGRASPNPARLRHAPERERCKTRVGGEYEASYQSLSRSP